MKVVFFLTITLFSSLSLFAQKQDYIWFFGKDQSAEPGVQALKFDFNKIPFSPETRNGGLEFDQVNSSICDEAGNLLFYTNGCAVANRNHQVMPNGDSINYGLFFQVLWLDDCGNGYPGRQDVLILPDPNQKDGYYIIHKPETYNPNQNPSIRIIDLDYTYVDMTLDNELGDVVEKNITFAQDTFLFGYLTAIQHQNQKDWWIYQPERYNNRIFVFLLSKSGINFHHFEYLDFPFPTPNSSASGEAKFSPDGKQYAIYSKFFGLLLFDFDRSTGTLSNYRFHQKHLSVFGEIYFATLEFSPNSRFLYLAAEDSLWQVDTWEENLAEGDVLIDIWNGVDDPFPTTFFTSTLGPDCRIYIRSGSGTQSFHIIHHPNEKGSACRLEQQGLKLPYYSSTGGFTNPPRWRVDAAMPCDSSISVGLFDLQIEQRNLKIFPNPAMDIINFELPDNYKFGNINIVDQNGRLTKNVAVDSNHSNIQINIASLPTGNYYFEFIPEDFKDYIFYSGMFQKIK